MNLEHSKIRISVSWNELPAYAAKVLSESKKLLGQPFNVISTVPKVPIKGMESILKQKVHWVDPEGIQKWDDLSLPIPNIFFSGWLLLCSFA